MGSLSAVRPRPALLLMLAGVVALLAAGAVGAMAANGFSDVSDDSVHATGIGWMVHAKVTAGCGGDRFCPTDGVTRAQMGTFMHRLSGNAPGIPPSVNAAAVGGVDAEVILARLDALETELADANAQLAAYETLLAGVTRQSVAGRDTLRFSGMNVQVVNGTGSTDGTPNGRGNLIIGYDTARTTGGASDKSGTHRPCRRPGHGAS
jgi:multidrug efflux pump subunit AcrA (membrane-fusion protein)